MESGSKRGELTRPHKGLESLGEASTNLVHVSRFPNGEWKSHSQNRNHVLAGILGGCLCTAQGAHSWLLWPLAIDEPFFVN